jgi:hypothetical protein
MSRLDDLGREMVRRPLASPSTLDQLSARNRRRRRRRWGVAVAGMAAAVGIGSAALAGTGGDDARVDVITDEGPDHEVGAPTTTRIPPPTTSAATTTLPPRTDPIQQIPLDLYDPALGPLGNDPDVCAGPSPAQPDLGGWTEFPSDGAVMPEMVGLAYRTAVDVARAHWPHQRVVLGLAFRDDVPEGEVVGTEPNPGEALAPDTVVVLRVAADPSRDAAGPTLEGSESGLPMSSRMPGPSVIAGFVSSIDSDAPVTFLGGEVVGCSLLGVGFVWLDQLFALDVPVAVMPSVVGLTRVEANDILRPFGLSGISTSSSSCAFGIGEDGELPMAVDQLVVAQTPSAGDDILRSTDVSLEVECGLTVPPGIVLISLDEVSASLAAFARGDEISVGGAGASGDRTIGAELVSWQPDRSMVTLAVDHRHAIHLVEADAGALRFEPR